MVGCERARFQTDTQTDKQANRQTSHPEIWYWQAVMSQKHRFTIFKRIYIFLTEETTKLTRKWPRHKKWWWQSTIKRIKNYVWGLKKNSFVCEKLAGWDFLSLYSAAKNAPWARGGQANTCGRYADLVGTKMNGLQIFSMGLQIFSIMYFN